MSELVALRSCRLRFVREPPAHLASAERDLEFLGRSKLELTFLGNQNLSSSVLKVVLRNVLRFLNMAIMNPR